MEHLSDKPSLGQRFSNWSAKYVRVWRLLRKPTMGEFKTISKVSALGILIIGALGFVISVAMTLAFN